MSPARASVPSPRKGRNGSLRVLVGILCRFTNPRSIAVIVHPESIKVCAKLWGVNQTSSEAIYCYMSIFIQESLYNESLSESSMHSPSSESS